MASKLFNLYLDMGGQGSVPHIEIRRNDYDSNVFSVQVTQNGLPFDFTGMTPIFECLTPDGHYIRDDGSQYGTFSNINAAQGTFQYTLVNEVFAVLGQIDVAYFAFEQAVTGAENPVKRLSTGNFTFAVIADALTGTTAAADYMSDVTTLINNINQLKADYTTLNPANYVTTAQLAENTNDYSYTLGFLSGLNQIRTRSILKVNGFYSLDDGASGKYRVLSIDGTETWTNILDGAGNTIFQLDGKGEISYPNSSKKLKLVIKDGKVNVKMLGAKGDGVNDDIFFTNACTLLNKVTLPNDTQTGKAILFIPDGRYDISEINVPVGTTIEGTGFWNTMIILTRGRFAINLDASQQNFPGTIIRKINIRGANNADAIGTINIGSATSVMITNCWLGSNIDINITNSSEIVITHCIADYASKHIVTNNVNNLEIANNIFYNAKVAVCDITGGRNIRIYDNICEVLWANGFLVNGSYDVEIYDNKLFWDNANVNPSSYCINLTGVTKGKIRNNNFHDSIRTYAPVKGIYSNPSCVDIEIIDNTLDNTGYGIVADGGGTLIKGNKLIAINTYPLKVNVACQIEKNKIINGNEGQGTDINLGCGITINASGCTLERNTVVCSNKHLLYALIIENGLSATLIENDFGKGSDYNNSYTAVQTTVGATLTTKYYVINQGTFPDSVATDVATLNNNFNSLLAVLRATNMIN